MEEKELERIVILEQKQRQSEKEVDVIKQDIIELKGGYTQQNLNMARFEAKLDNFNQNIINEIKGLSEKYDNQNKRFEKIERDRLDELEEPHKQLSKIKWGIISAIATLIGSGLFLWVINNITFN